MLFNTKFNTATYNIKYEAKDKVSINSTTNITQQQLTTKEKESLNLISNRKVFGSKFDNFEFDSKKDHFGRIEK
jgi:hypothetical protein